MSNLFSITALIFSSLMWMHLNAEAQSNPPIKALPPKVEIARVNALETQKSCMHFVQMNVFEFEECIHDRLQEKKWKPAERLGITYMGFVGALSAQRMGSQGSQAMAWKYAKKSLAIQKKLGVKDLDLCEIVPGDCETRLARTAFILQSPAPTPLTEAEIANRHKH